MGERSIQLPRRLTRSVAVGMIASLLILNASCTTGPEVADPEPERVEGPQRFGLHFESTTALGLPPVSPSYGMTAVDFNLDGWSDLLVGRHKRHPRFFVNQSGVLQGRPLAALDEPAPGRAIYDLHGCSWGEANGDGRPDVYCVSGAQDGQGEGPNRLLIQTEAGNLSDQAAAFGLVDSRGRGRTANWMDVDRDGDLDLFVANEIRAGVPSALFENVDGETFRRVDSPLAAEFPVRSSASADWNNDGYPDILVLGHGFTASRAFLGGQHGFVEVQIPLITGAEWLSATFEDLDNDAAVDVILVSEDRVIVMRNRNGSLVSGEELSVKGGRMATLLDVENDGDLDIFLVRGAMGDPPPPGARNLPDLLYTQGGNGELHRRAVPSLKGPAHGNGNASVAADFDRDGAVDLFVANGYLDVGGPFQFLRNTSEIGNWVEIELVGDDRNPLAIGSTVHVSWMSREITRFVTDEVAFQTQGPVRLLHVGIDDGDEVEIEVTWPDGQRSCTRSRANEQIQVQRSDNCST